MKAEIRDDFLPKLSFVKLKSPELKELWDEIVLGEKSGFWNGSGVTEALGC